MGVYIKGMVMPKSCFECPFMFHRCFCLVNPRIEFTDDEYSELKGRYSGCPLVSVPSHGRLIDGDVLADGCDEPYWCRWRSEIEDAPTIIPAEGGEKENE